MTTDDGTRVFAERPRGHPAALDVVVCGFVGVVFEIALQCFGGDLKTLGENAICGGDGLQLRQVRVVLVPATELPRLKAGGGDCAVPEVRVLVPECETVQY